MLVRLTAAVVPLFLASAAAAQQWVPGSELMGQQVQVTTNGVTNIITFEPNGVARISSPSGGPRLRQGQTVSRRWPVACSRSNQPP